tara:strand:- start:1354 stop:1542 length:189 start_codon:yes stop_codon:yes gene_type:complete
LRNKKEKDKGIALNCELVGIKNLKSTYNWRIELDIYEIDSHKVEQLVHLVGKPIVTAIVENG